MVWQPLNLTEVCPASSTAAACSSVGFMYLSLIAQIYGGSADLKKQQVCDAERGYAKEEFEDHYDFIIVGAGAAGCVMANKLTENPHWKVLLLEAGGEEPDLTAVPGFFTALMGSSLDYSYTLESNGKSCLAFPEGKCGWPRGKVMGGSTSINAMAYVRGNKKDYDMWAKMGNKGWSYEEVLPYFMKTERNVNKYSVDEDYHGAMGEQYVSWLPYVDGPASMMTEAFTEAGVPYGDFNGASQFHNMQAQVTAMEGERMSTNRVYINPIRHQRKNLVIKTHSVATKIIIDEHKTARGIVYVKNGKKYKAYAKKEVIVSGGVVESPKLLMLSGIGPKKHLESLNIPVVQNLAVGENLQDHVAFNGLIIALPDEIATTVSHEQMLRDIKEFATMKHKRDSPLAGLGPIMSAAFIKTDECLDAPNIQLQVNHAPNWTEYMQDPIFGEKAAIWPTAYYNGMIPRIMNLTPKSRGKILLNKDDPLGPPAIHINYLDDERDIEPLLKGIKFMLSLEETEAFKSRGAYYVREQFPHCTEHEWGTDEYFLCLIRQYTSCTHHQVGTCKMGPKRDKKAVVDHELRVYGVKSLRVIDASVIPVVMRGNTNAPTIMIAQKAIEGVIKYWQERTNNYCF